MSCDAMRWDTLAAHDEKKSIVSTKEMPQKNTAATGKTKAKPRKNAVAPKKNTGTEIVCYTGVGAKKSGVHSDAEFLKAIESARCTNNCPAAGDVAGWTEWAGALRRTPARCKALVANNRRAVVVSKALDRANAVFDACVESKRCTSADRTSGGINGVAKCAAMRCPGPSRRLHELSTELGRVMRKKT